MLWILNPPWELHHGNSDNVEHGDGAEDLLGGEHVVGVGEHVEHEGGEGDDQRSSL